MVMRLCVLTITVSLLSATALWADVRYYLVPRIGNGVPVPLSQLSDTTGEWRPKYVDPGALGAGNDLGTWSAMPYGSENAFLLAVDATTAQHTALAAQSDVLAVPTALDSNVSALAVTTIQTKLESVNLPADWIDTGLTYRQVLRRIGKIILFAQRFQGLHGARLMDGIAMSTRWNQLTAAQQDRLRAAAESWGVDYSAVTNTTTMRQLLRILGDQLPPFSLQGNDF